MTTTVPAAERRRCRRPDAAPTGRARRVRGAGQRQPGRHQRAVQRRRALPPRPPRSGAICMADGYARVSGRVGVCSVHQGPGLTNTMTGLTEAAKSRTPLLVLAGETPAAALTSNFRIDQHGLVESVGAVAERVHGPATAADDALRAYQRALVERRPVVLMLPIDIQPQAAQPRPSPSGRRCRPCPRPSRRPQAVAAAADLLQRAQRPVIIAGRGAVLADAARRARASGGDRRGAGHLGARQRPVRRPPLCAGHLRRVRLAVRDRAAAPGRRGAGVGRLGQPLDDEARRADRRHRQGRPDRHRGARDRPQPPRRPGRWSATPGAGARRSPTSSSPRPRATGLRTPEMAAEIRPTAGPRSLRGRLDRRVDRPAHAHVALNGLLPAEKAVAVDSGHFLGYPAMFLDVPDARAGCSPTAFRRWGWGWATPSAPRSPGPTAHGGGDRRRRRVHGAGRDRDRGPAGAQAARAHLRRPRLRRRGPPLRAPWATTSRACSSPTPTWPRSRGPAVRRAAPSGARRPRRRRRVAGRARGAPARARRQGQPTICAEWLAEAFRAG